MSRVDDLRELWIEEGVGYLRWRQGNAESAFDRLEHKSTDYAKLIRRSARAWRLAADAYEAEMTRS